MLCGRADCYIYSRWAGAKAQCAGQTYRVTMTTLSEIYNARILELAAAIPHATRLAEPDATATAHSKLCGSTVSVDLKMAGDRVAAYGQSVKACLLGQSAASVMGREIIGSTATELRQVGAQMRRMLKEGGEPPTGRWADLGVLQPVKDYKARHASTLLVFDAVERALDEIEARSAGSRPMAETAASRAV
jgi:NifU-like protein involved in Fe-S cluster formation